MTIETTPEYKLMQFFEDFEVVDNDNKVISLAQMIENQTEECIKATKIQQKMSSFSIKVEFKPNREHHLEINAEINSVKIPKAKQEAKILFVDAYGKMHQHGDPKQLRLGEENVKEFKKIKEA